jgi:hypothetical protein
LTKTNPTEGEKAEIEDLIDEQEGLVVEQHKNDKR